MTLENYIEANIDIIDKNLCTFFKEAYDDLDDEEIQNVIYLLESASISTETFRIEALNSVLRNLFHDWIMRNNSKCNLMAFLNDNLHNYLGFNLFEIHSHIIHNSYIWQDQVSIMTVEPEGTYIFNKLIWK